MIQKKILSLDTIGGRIAFIRGEMRQEDFAVLLGVSRMTLIRYEKGERQPDADFLKTIVAEFGVDGSWLLLGDGDLPSIKLTPREAALLDNYRHCPDDAQRNLETMGALLAQSSAGKKKVG
ncbi:Helix-turn-helix [Humidesulfovibrio mexicanus]|uniref:Helix-turn-helix n=1 Tax=Humidesulfovibrio mexicanus TaxID=147047 RepID=A0A239BEA3_9BACT|nr:helix-turn-helix transcriptional regulator [Humidesulfovibrio mexicanus]SNS05952.1 Helix-turn-helix [Humidesulfovibrio mexicanus]